MTPEDIYNQYAAKYEWLQSLPNDKLVVILDMMEMMYGEGLHDGEYKFVERLMPGWIYKYTKLTG